MRRAAVVLGGGGGGGELRMWLNESPFPCAALRLQTGWLVTVANVGDSLIGMETADGFKILSADHRLNENPAEVERLLKSAILPLFYSSA